MLHRLVIPSMAAAWIAVTAAGCAFFGGGSITDKATQAERLQCEAEAAGKEDRGQDDLRVLRTTAILQVEGHYDYHESGIGKVTATRILVRPPEGVSTARLTRILQCHNARVVLGRAGEAELPDDPYALSDAWVDIDVKEEEGNYLVSVSADHVSDNLRVLRRAKAFAAAQRAAAPPPAL
jgi:hypothetical protein